MSYWFFLSWLFLWFLSIKTTYIFERRKKYTEIKNLATVYDMCSQPKYILIKPFNTLDRVFFLFYTSTDNNESI